MSKYSNKENYTFYMEEFIRISNEIGRPIQQRELKSYNLPDYRYFINNYPNGKLKLYSDFIKICGFDYFKFDTTITDDELLKMIKTYCDNNEIPKQSELKKVGLPSGSVIRKRFGTYQNALILAGVDLSDEKSFTKIRNISDEELLRILKEYNDDVRFPTSRNLGGKDLPSHQTYLNRFGSFRNALMLANISVPKDKEWLYVRKPYTKDELLFALDYYTKEKLKNDLCLISTSDLKNGTYKYAF